MTLRAQCTSFHETVIGIGVMNSTSDLLMSNCDEFIVYDDLVRDQQSTAKRRKKPAPKKVAPRKAAPKKAASRKKTAVKKKTAKKKTARKRR